VWFGAISVPAIFVMFVLEAHGKAAWTESLGRLAFLVGMGAAAAYTYFVVKPGGPVATLYKLDGVMQGALQELVDALNTEHQARLLQEQGG